MATVPWQSGNLFSGAGSSRALETSLPPEFWVQIQLS